MNIFGKNVAVSLGDDAFIFSTQTQASPLFRFGLRKLLGGTILVRPRVLVAFRAYAPGRWSIKNMATAGGAREVSLIEMGMATAIGMQLDVQEPAIKAVLSVSDDWFEFSEAGQTDCQMKGAPTICWERCFCAAPGSKCSKSHDER